MIFHWFNATELYSLHVWRQQILHSREMLVTVALDQIDWYTETWLKGNGDLSMIGDNQFVSMWAIQ